MPLDATTYFIILNLFLLSFFINSVYTGGRSGEHVHIKLHIPEVYKKHTHVQTIVKHHFHPPPLPKQKKVHHYHHHHHSHKSKSKSNSHIHFENLPVHSSPPIHYEIPVYKPKKISPIYSTEYHYGGGVSGGYKPMKSVKYSDDSFRPSIPLYSVDEDSHVPEYSYHSQSHDDVMEEPENEYDETKTTPYYTKPLLGQQPLHTSFQSSSLVNDNDNDDDDDDHSSQWNGLLSKKYKSNDIKLESAHGTTWPLSIPTELETYSTIPQYSTKSKKPPKFLYDSDNYELGYTNLDFVTAPASLSSDSVKLNKKWPSSYSTRLFTKQNYED